MILDVVAFRNKKMGVYTNPTFTQEKLENLETNYSRFFIASEEGRKKHTSLALYHFGTFDDVAGKYDLLAEPVLLFDCDDIIAGIESVGAE